MMSAIELSMDKNQRGSPHHWGVYNHDLTLWMGHTLNLNREESSSSQKSFIDSSERQPYPKKQRNGVSHFVLEAHRITDKKFTLNENSRDLRS